MYGLRSRRSEVQVLSGVFKMGQRVNLLALLLLDLICFISEELYPGLHFRFVQLICKQIANG